MFDIERINKLIGSVMSLGFGSMLLVNRVLLKQSMLESAKRVFGVYSVSRALVADIFIWTIGVVLIFISIIFLAQFFKILPS